MPTRWWTWDCVTAAELWPSSASTLSRRKTLHNAFDKLLWSLSQTQFRTILHPSIAPFASPKCISGQNYTPHSRQKCCVDPSYLLIKPSLCSWIIRLWNLQGPLPGFYQFSVLYYLPEVHSQGLKHTESHHSIGPLVSPQANLIKWYK